MQEKKKGPRHSKMPLKKIMVSGITCGIIISQLVLAGDAKPNALDTPKKGGLLDLAAATDGNITSHLMTEDELLLELNSEGVKLYQSLSPEGKQLAIKIASRSCNGQNECKGEGACKTPKNDCAGKNECKGQTKCGFANKNEAIKVAAKKMATKREALQK